RRTARRGGGARHRPEQRRRGRCRRNGPPRRRQRHPTASGAAPAGAVALARALSALGDGAQVGDAARLAGLAGAALEAAMGALVSAEVVEAGGPVRFTHPILRSAIYGELSPAERERMHRAAATILRERGAPP